MPNLDVRQEALHYLVTHQVLTLATNGPLGLWAAAVFYVNDNFHLYFLSAGHTRHAQNMADNGHVAGTIQEDYQQWEAIKGIQLEGTVTLLTGAARLRALTLYGKKYLFMNTSTPAIQNALAKVNWYRLVPDTLYFVDNQKGFGHRDEIFLGK